MNNSLQIVKRQLRKINEAREEKDKMMSVLKWLFEMLRPTKQGCLLHQVMQVVIGGIKVCPMTLRNLHFVMKITC